MVAKRVGAREEEVAFVCLASLGERPEGQHLASVATYSKQQAQKAAEAAREKGWPAKVVLEQEHMDIATVIAKKPGTEWYLVARWVNAMPGADAPCLRLWMQGKSSLKYLAELIRSY